MSRLFKNHGTEPGKMLKAKTTTGTLLFSAVLLSALSSNVLANRPSMLDRSEETDEATSEIPVQPSSVEIMLQQQSQQPQTGDVLQLPAKEIQPGETVKIKLLDYPRRGMSMDRVQSEYGQPIAISDSVGKPPITRWTYSDRVVYFEFSTVLHVVAR